MSAQPTPPYTSLNVTLRDLIDQCDNTDVIAALIKKDSETTGTGEGYSRVMEELWKLPSTPPCYPILISIWYNDGTDPQDDTIDVGFWNPGYVPPPEGLKSAYGLRGKPASAGHYDYEAAIHQQHFGMGFTPWAELIDATVYVSDVEAVTRLCPTLAHVLAEILWEITFYGYSDGEIQEVAAGIKVDIDEYLAGNDTDTHLT